eukprot:snap_masked-scaffold_3-processed-gene-6.17-mRNA-1 protein AED:1.00 eAED:1.00 QI:0/-1/0/0/-1/1/1/0/143
MREYSIWDRVLSGHILEDPNTLFCLDKRREQEYLFIKIKSRHCNLETLTKRPTQLEVDKPKTSIILLHKIIKLQIHNLEPRGGAYTGNVRVVGAKPSMLKVPNPISAPDTMEGMRSYGFREITEPYEDKYRQIYSLEIESLIW